MITTTHEMPDLSGEILVQISSCDDYSEITLRIIDGDETISCELDRTDFIQLVNRLKIKTSFHENKFQTYA